MEDKTKLDVTFSLVVMMSVLRFFREVDLVKRPSLQYKEEMFFFVSSFLTELLPNTFKIHTCSRHRRDYRTELGKE